MFIFVGLGNIGDRYENTPHNAGFRFLDLFREYVARFPEVHISDWREESKFKAIISVLRVGGEQKILLVKPTTFMNLSGDTVRSITAYHRIDLATQLLIIHDDLDLEIGRFKVQFAKGPRNHKGILDIEQKLGTKEFVRIRLGVWSEEVKRINPADYVIKVFSKANSEQLDIAITQVVETITEDIVLSQ